MTEGGGGGGGGGGGREGAGVDCPGGNQSYLELRGVVAGVRLDCCPPTSSWDNYLICLLCLASPPAPPGDTSRDFISQLKL